MQNLPAEWTELCNSVLITLARWLLYSSLIAPTVESIQHEFPVSGYGILSSLVFFFFPHEALLIQISDTNFKSQAKQTQVVSANLFACPVYCTSQQLAEMIWERSALRMNVM